MKYHHHSVKHRKHIGTSSERRRSASSVAQLLFYNPFTCRMLLISKNHTSLFIGRSTTLRMVTFDGLCKISYVYQYFDTGIRHLASFSHRFMPRRGCLFQNRMSEEK